MAKPRMTGFVSYARADAPLVDDFLKRMRLRCTTLRDLDVGDWSDDRIMVGQGWAEEIAGAVEFSDFGLLCVTHAFSPASWSGRWSCRRCARTTS